MSEDLPRARKSLGQHWLTSPAALESICSAGEVTPDDTIVEIGPGTGTLTSLLVRQAKNVIAVEYDPILAAALPERVPADNLEVVTQDILRFDFSKVPAGYKVIANIPYYLTSNLIRVLSETPNQAERVVILIQKEVARRVAALPGAYSLLSVSAQYYWDVSLGVEIPAKLFTPPPKVDSQVVLMHRRAQELFPGADEKQFFRLVRLGFSARRKTLLNSLSAGLRVEKDVTKAVLNECYIEPSLRAQNLSLEQWYMLYTACLKQGLL
ncbi:MAG: 16S rRNA (adenine(1518)-N(6)/adenine(1519)-N(6))-dimethyltransferase RsmA [Candidatus Saccharimonadales bacterium]